MAFLVSHHGLTGANGGALYNTTNFADARDVKAYSPRFDSDRFSSARYQKVPAAEAVVESALLKSIRTSRGDPREPCWIFGHSAGGQYLSRVAAYAPPPWVTRYVVANPSTWVWPDDRAEPFGFGAYAVGAVRDAVIAAYLALPLTVYIGENDDDPNDPDLDTSADAMLQGAHRRERAENVWDAAQAAATSLGVTCNWTRVYALGVAHSGTGMLNASERDDAFDAGAILQPPVATAAPTQSGTATEGEVQTGSGATWASAPDEIASRWTVDDVATGDTDTSYTPDAGDVGGLLAFEQRARITGGPWSLWQQSTQVSVQAAGDGTAPTGTIDSFGPQASDGDVPIVLSAVSEDCPNSYWALTGSSTQPTVQQIVDGQDDAGAAAAASGAVALSSGSPTFDASLPNTLGGTYHLHLVLGDAADNRTRLYGGSSSIVTTAPTVSAVSGTQTGQTTATWAATSNRAGGVLHAVAYVDGTTEPTASEVIAGSGATVVAASTDATPTANSANGGSFTDLTAATDYRVKAVQVDAVSNQSTGVVSAATFTTASAASAATFVQANTVSVTTANQTVYPSGSITISSGANRMVVLLVAVMDSTNSVFNPTATFGAGATPMTRVALATNSERVASAVFVLPNPPSGAATATVTTATQREACAMQLVELTDADQTIGNILSGAFAPGVGNSASVQLTPATAGWVSLSALCIQSGDYTGELSLTGGMTQIGSGFTGTNNFNDLTFAAGRKDLASSGADTTGWTITTATQQIAMARIAVGPA